MTVEHWAKEAFERMLVCGNTDCMSYGDDTPDWTYPDRAHRCLMCGVPKVHWRGIPLRDVKNLKHLVDLGIVPEEAESVI